MKKKKTEVHQAEGTNLEEDQDIDMNSRDAITAKTIAAIEGSVHFDELVMRCDDAYVAADPENHKSDIQEARIVLKRNLEVAPIYSRGVIQVKGDMIFKEASA